MRRLVIILWAVLVGVMARAGEPVEVQPFEGEVGVGLTVLTDKKAGMSNGCFVNAAAELRYNLRRVPVALGLTAMYNSATRTDIHGAHDNSGGFLVGAVGEYNFMRGHRWINPFAGASVGVFFRNEQSAVPYFQPRIGIEVLTHIRVTAGFIVADAANMGFTLGVGVVFGGRPRK